MTPQAADSTKLRELILYIAARMEQDQHVGRGRIKLAKLVFQIDFAAFAQWGAPISGVPYHADKLGPVPDGEKMVTLDLEAAGRLRWETLWDKERLPVAIGRPADMEVFAPHERNLIDSTLAEFQQVSAKRMVDQAHRFPGWLLAWRDGEGEGDPVPFGSIFWDPKRLPGTRAAGWENEHAKQLAGRYGDRITP